MTNTPRNHPFEGPEVFDDEPQREQARPSRTRVYLMGDPMVDPSFPTVRELENATEITNALIEDLEPWPYTSAAVQAIRAEHFRQRANLGNN
jgi:hypothetical protein